MKSFVAFFKAIIKVTIVINSEEGVVEVSRGLEVSGGRPVDPSELVAGCVEHGLRVCREGPWKVR